MTQKKKVTAKSTVEGKKAPARQCYQLYITGASPNSSRAVANIKNLFGQHLAGRHELDIIDIYQQPKIASAANIIALPLLIRTFPLPEKRFIGDMSDVEKLVQSLNLTSA